MNQTVIVKEGDTLSGIVYDKTGSVPDDYSKIVSDSNLSSGDPNLIKPGEKVVVDVDSSNANKVIDDYVNSNNVSRYDAMKDLGFSKSDETIKHEEAQRNVVEAKLDAQSKNMGTTSITNSLSQSKNMETTSVTNSSSQSSSTNNSNSFSYLDEEDQIQYDADKAITLLQGVIDTDITTLCKDMVDIIASLDSIQKYAYDIEGTSVSEDYKDFEAVIGDASLLTGVNGFVYQANKVCVNMYDTMNAFKNATEKK
ncbi:MAG TPA: hypothetical protein PLC25_02805 [Bacilli bacterium]|nr:hypothetical protein [Bacilli bacterium]